MIVAIYAFENMYGGLHGICNHRITEVDSMQEAWDLGVSDSMDVIDSYGDIMEGFEDSAEFEGLERDSDEWNAFIADCIEDNIDFQIWEVIPYDTIKSMEEDFYNNQDDFVKNHCREISF